MRQDPSLSQAPGSICNAELAAENAALRARLEAVEAERKIELLRGQEKDAKIFELQEELQSQLDYIAWLVKQAQGPTSERRSWESLEPEAQLWLEGMALKLPESPPPSKTTVKEHERERRENPTDISKTGRIKHGPNATIIDVDVKNPEVEDIPEDQLELVETKTTQKVVRVSSPFMIINVHSKTYRRKDDFEEIVPPEIPEVFENSIYDVSFLAGSTSLSIANIRASRTVTFFWTAAT